MDQKYAQKLTDEDINSILDKCGLKVVENLPQPIMRGENDNGQYSIMVKAVPRYINTDKAQTVSAYPVGGGRYLFLNDYAPSWEKDVILIEINDFVMYEIASMESEEKWMDISIFLSNMYNEYMKAKFGTEYSIDYENYCQEQLKEENIEAI